MKVDKKTIHEFGVLPKNTKLHTYTSQESTSSVSSDISTSVNPSRTIGVIAPVLEDVRGEQGLCKVLMVGCGTTLDSIIDEANKRFRGSHQITAASTDKEFRPYDCILAADEYDCFVIHWDPEEFEEELIEITENICDGKLDVIVCCEPDVRTLKRCLHCLRQGGTLVTTQDANDKENVKALARRKKQTIIKDL
ncbi:PREDICTED: uncharacterized protein LOC106811544 [Priapulus caudatus]|uniref:Uncharacterized protein LOC106811544 n=1 Tax=Priapulus caudatus TaxID=37621 RepID=A0ABM1EES7_PRICU|nr:PREDICTED: uncharacterized protein LOC106811544 [Priapulus caudatus]